MVAATCMSLEGLSWNNSIIPCQATHSQSSSHGSPSVIPLKYPWSYPGQYYVSS